MKQDSSKNVLSFVLALGILAFTAGVIFLTNTTLQDIKHAIPVTILEQERDVALLLQNTTELKGSVREAHLSPSPKSLIKVMVRLQKTEQQLNRIRSTYKFDNLLGASAIHAVIYPALVDARTWLTKGLYSNAPNSPMILSIIDVRLTQALQRVNALSLKSNQSAVSILKQQSLRIEEFRNEIITVLMVLAAMGVFLAVHVYRLRKAEETILRSEERFKGFAVSASDWFWEMGPDFRFTYVSERVTEATSLHISDVIGKKREEFSHLDVHSESWIKHLSDMENHLPFKDFEYAAFPPEGGTVHIQVSGLPIFSRDGEFLGYRGTGTNITARKRAEKANVDKSAFLAAASHDMRQPLQAINLFLYALKSNETSVENQDIINMIEKSTSSLGYLLDSLLDLSRLESGVVKIQKKQFSVSTLFGHIADEYLQSASEKGLDLSFEPCSLSIHSDPVLLENILRNLIANAIKYTPSGKVLIGCRRKGPSKLQIQVWDTGNGIADEQQSKIFNEFYQIGVNPGNAVKGLGLGLSIVQKVATLLNHDLGVSSKIGLGSMFSVTVPLAATILSDQSTKASQQAENTLKDLSIIVIDDEEAVRKSLTVMLSTANNRVASAPFVDCRDNVQMLTFPRAVPDIVIADYRLASNKTGVEAIADLKEFYGSDMPAILLTGDTAPERLKEISQSGYTLLHKPVNGKELLEKIHAVLDTEVTK